MLEDRELASLHEHPHRGQEKDRKVTVADVKLAQEEGQAPLKSKAVKGLGVGLLEALLNRAQEKGKLALDLDVGDEEDTLGAEPVEGEHASRKYSKRRHNPQDREGEQAAEK